MSGESRGVKTDTGHVLEEKALFGVNGRLRPLRYLRFVDELSGCLDVTSFRTVIENVYIEPGMGGRSQLHGMGRGSMGDRHLVALPREWRGGGLCRFCDLRRRR